MRTFAALLGFIALLSSLPAMACKVTLLGQVDALRFPDLRMTARLQSTAKGPCDRRLLERRLRVAECHPYDKASRRCLGTWQTTKILSVKSHHALNWKQVRVPTKILFLLDASCSMAYTKPSQPRCFKATSPSGRHKLQHQFLDGSRVDGSDYATCREKSRFEVARDAVRALLRAISQVKHDKLRVSVKAFDALGDTPHFSGMSGYVARARLSRAVEQLRHLHPRERTTTPLYRALYREVSALRRDSAAGLVFLLTDGIDDTPDRERWLRQLQGLFAAKKGPKLYVLKLGEWGDWSKAPGSHDRRAARTLQDLAVASGGILMTTGTDAQLARILPQKAHQSSTVLYHIMARSVRFERQPGRIMSINSRLRYAPWLLPYSSLSGTQSRRPRAAPLPAGILLDVGKVGTYRARPPYFVVQHHSLGKITGIMAACLFVCFCLLSMGRPDEPKPSDDKPQKSYRNPGFTVKG